MYEGSVEQQFAPVAQAFGELMQERQQRGAALCVQVAGQTVVDIWAGQRDRARQHPWQKDTLVNIFSSGKPLLAVVVLQLIQEGRLGLDDRVADYWPEFAVQGKASVRVRHLLNHQAGLPAISQPLPAPALFDWAAMVQALEQQSPWWEPGTAHGYMPMTYGWLLGELVQRIEGCSPGEAIARRIAQPHGLHCYVGLTPQQQTQVSDVSHIAGAVGDEIATRLLDSVLKTDSLTAKAFINPPSMLTSSNKPEWRAMQQPAANAHSDARSLAGFYSALLRGELLAPEWLAQMQQEQSYGPDRTLLTTTRFGLGCMLEQTGSPAASFALGEQAFGHPGAGGTLGCADPERQLSVAFVTNSLGAYVLMDPRARTLNQHIMRCL